MRIPPLLALTALILFAASSSWTQTPTTEEVAPTFASIHSQIFQKKCIECHQADQALGGVNLDSYDSVMKSASSHGHSIVIPGNPGESHLLESVVSGSMPPGTPKLSDAEIQAIRAWIQQGAQNN